jgi:hypothetical protein
VNKFVFQFLAGTLDELKANINNEKSKDCLARIKGILSTEISIPCLNVVVNKSDRAQNFYGMIVFPKTILSDEKGIEIKSYVVEIQRQLLEVLSGKQIAALLLHDLSHNVMTYTAIERLKSAIYHACKMTNMKVVDVLYNIDSKARDLALLDIANRTYKDPIIPDTEMYEADRIIVDMGICNEYNSALQTIDREVEEFDISNPENQFIADNYIATILIRIVMEKAKGMTLEYYWHKKFVERTYDTNIFKMYPSIDIELKEEQFGQRVSETEDLKPYELSMLQETTLAYIKDKQKLQEGSLIIESVFKQKRPNLIALQKEIDIITFKLQSLSSNYERLNLLDRVYDNVYLIEKYLEENPTDEPVQEYLQKFLALPQEMKEMKPSKKQYGVFVEYPAGYTE